MGTTHTAWPVEYPCETGDIDNEQLVVARRFAQSLLWSRTGRRYGVATTVAELYRASTSDGCWYGPVRNLHGDWINARQGHGCCGLHLEHQPVRSIIEVRVDGAALGADEYVLEGATLRRLNACWPHADECDAARIEVDYEWGAGFPVGAAAAMGELVCEVLAAMRGEPCRLPSRVVSITRQGVSMDLADPDTFITSGLLGLPLCDALITTENPHRLVSRSRVFSPDLGRRVG